MRESSTYQAILDEGRVAQARDMLLRLGTRRFGPPSETIRTALLGMTDLERLDVLGERLLDASSWQALLAAL